MSKKRHLNITMKSPHPPPPLTAEMSLKDPGVLLRWLQEQVKGHEVTVTNLSTSWSDGIALCALIYHFNPELM